MDKMFELINSLNALTKAVAVLTEKITKEYLNTFETIYDPETDEPQAEASKEQPKEATTTEQPPSETKAVTFVQLRSRLAELSRAGHTDEIKALIQKHGAEKLSGIAESEYAALMKEAEQIGS